MGRGIGTELAVLTMTACLLVACSLSEPALAHSGDEIEGPNGSTPTIDGRPGASEWEDAGSMTITVEGDDCDIHFKHDRESFYVAFDIDHGHSTNVPDTRVYLDVDHDATDEPETEDFQLYINPDNGGLRERRGDGSGGWEEADIEDWDGDWDDGESDRWSTEYDILAAKLDDPEGETVSFGLAFLVHGNYGGVTLWPDSADPDDPSTWGDITLAQWEDPPDPDPEPDPQGNNTDTNQTGNQTEEDDEEGMLPAVGALGTAIILVAVGRRSS